MKERQRERVGKRLVEITETSNRLRGDVGSAVT